MSNPFLTLTEFGQSYASQLDFFDDIKAIINSLEGTPPIIIESTTVPTQVQMETAYLAAVVGSTLPVPTYQEFIWMNQGVVQGEYRTLDDIIYNLNDTSIVGTAVESPMVFLMANGDIISTNLSTSGDMAGTVTEKIMKYDRRTGQVANTGIPTNAITAQYSVNPARTKVAFTKLDGGGKKQIYTATYPAWGSVTQLTTSAVGCDNPSWQGTKISYLEQSGGNWTIKIMNDTGTSQTTVLATGVATSAIMYQQLSPDLLKICYTKVVGGTNMDVWKVLVAGTGNAKFIDSTNGTDNPSGDMTRLIMPNWSPDSTWIYYGRRRKNINTNAVEQWFDFSLENDTNHSLNDVYFNLDAKDWYLKNVATAISGLAGAQGLSIPTFSSFNLSNQLILTPTTYQGSTIMQAFPILMIANQEDGYTSTGKIYKTSQFVPDENDIELIRTDVATGTETTYSLSKTELGAFDHIMIILSGATAAFGTMRILFNEDGTAGNYLNTNFLAIAGTPIVRANQSFGDDGIHMRTSGALGSNVFTNIVTIYDIRSTDALKTAMTHAMWSASAAAFAIANYNVGDINGIWKSAVAIESMRIISTQAFAAGTSISYYGIRGTPRNEVDI